NQRRIASIYFTNEQDYLDALQKTVYYYHTKLEWCYKNTLTTKSSCNTKGKGIVIGSNTIKIINKRSFSSSENNRDINLQMDISGRTRHEPLKEQNRETSKARFKAIKISKENLYMNNSLASNIFKKKAQELNINEIKNLLINITSRLDIDEPVGSSSKVSGMNTNRKRLLQKELTLKIDCHNINRLKTNQQKFEILGRVLVGKKVENFKFFWSDTLIDKRKGLGIALGIKHTWKKYLEGIDKISEFIIAKFYFRNMELIIIAIYIPPNNRYEMDKVIKEITDIYSKRNKRTHIVILEDFNCVVNIKLDKISKSKTKKEVTWFNSQSDTKIDQTWVSENLMESLTRAEILDIS
ncbi:38301_t:CDS:2, partial [Gigaspora margarita]